MAVKRVVRKPKRKAMTKRRGMLRAPLAALVLPTVMAEPEKDISKYTTLIYGRAGIGKTTLCASFPKALFFATEPGTKGLDRFEFNADNGGVQSWETLIKGVDLLIADKGAHYKTVVIDTIAVAYSLCSAFVCAKLGVEHMADVGYGKAWAALDTEFSKQLYRIINADYGLVMTCHSKFSKISKHDGDEYDVIQPDLKGAALGVVKSITDCMFYCEFVKRAGDTTAKRILITEGDELVMAKARGKGWPHYLPMELDNGYKVISDAFDGTHKGISAKDIVTSKHTAKAAKVSIGLSRAKSHRAKKGG